MSNRNAGDGPSDLGIFGALSALALCCAIVAILAYTAGRNNERRDRAPAAYEAAARNSAESQCASLELRAAFDCIYEKVESSQDQARERQDLTAQQQAAFAALSSALLALLTLGITATGVIYVKRTLDATLDAVADTSKATQAMVRQTDLVENAQRPWLTVKINSIGPMERRIDGTYHCHYNVTVKNTGLSPAVTIGFTVGTEKATIDRQICFSTFVAEAYRLIAMTSAAVAPNSQDDFIGSIAVDMGEIDENGCRPNNTLPNLWLGAAYQDGVKDMIYYTLIVCSPGAYIKPGIGAEAFQLHHVKLKTLMGQIAN